jgi:hypothetical protein
MALRGTEFDRDRASVDPPELAKLALQRLIDGRRPRHPGRQDAEARRLPLRLRDRDDRRRKRGEDAGDEGPPRRRARGPVTRSGPRSNPSASRGPLFVACLVKTISIGSIVTKSYGFLRRDALMGAEASRSVNRLQAKAGPVTPNARQLAAREALATAFVVRARGQEPRLFSTWGARMIALIGRLSATLEDRAFAPEHARRVGAEPTACDIAVDVRERHVAISLAPSCPKGDNLRPIATSVTGLAAAAPRRPRRWP